MTNNSAPWSNFFQSLLRQFVSVHFVITAAMLWVWIETIGSPIAQIESMIQIITSSVGSGSIDETLINTTAEAIDKVTQSTIALSGIFTTVIGLVLGHYFGHKGVESAELAREKIQDMSSQLIEDFDGDAALLEEEMKLLDSELVGANAAVQDAIELLSAQGIEEIPDESPLSKYLQSLTEDRQKNHVGV